MTTQKHVYLGTDSGATTSKVAAIWSDGAPVGTKLLQQSTNSREGPAAVVRTWVTALNTYLEQHNLSWDNVQGVGLAIPGPFRCYGVLDRSANLPESFIGFDVHTAYSTSLAERAGRPIPLTVGNDGDLAGVAEAHQLRAGRMSSVLLLAPGSGLGCAYIDQAGLPLSGATLAGMEAGHMPALLHELNVPAYPCGCGRTWGCIEVYTTLSGLPHLLNAELKKHPEHPLATSPLSVAERSLALRGLAQNGDPLANALFDFQARALGLHVANMAMALDPGFVVIGGGLMEPEATTAEFRERYLQLVRDTAAPYLWPAQRTDLQIVAAQMGDLSQAFGAALVALYTAQR